MALDEKQFIEIVQKLSEIGSDVKAMHRRQDITNGRIAKNEEKVIEMDKKLVGVDSFITEVRTRNTQQDADKKDDKESKRYWTRQFIERVCWIVLALAMVVLTKLGIINLHI